MSQFHVADVANNIEIITVTNVSGTTWTVTRGAEGTTPVTHSSGFTIYQVTTAGFLGLPPQWFNVRSPLYGAAGNGTTDDTTAIQAAWTAAVAANGTMYFPPGNYKTTSTVGGNINSASVRIFADPGAKISYYGSGDCLQFYDSSSYSEPPRTYGPNSGIFGFLVIDGTHSSASAASTGLHCGDILQLGVHCTVRNFANFAGSIGVHFDNQNYWTEQLYGRVFAENCVSHVVFDVSGATTSTASFGRADIGIYINQVNAAYDGLVVQNGAEIYDGAIALRGNFVGSASALTSTPLRVTGTVPAGHPGAGNSANIADCRLDVGLECVTNTHTPTTMLFGSNNNKIINCYGILDFGTDDSAANFTAAARIGNIVPFFGAIKGDSTLQFGAQGFQAGSTFAATGGFAYGDFSTASSVGNGGTISSNKGFIRLTTSGAVTGVILAAGSFDGQVLYLANESANSITFAVSGTSHVADGTSDVIAAKAGATFIFEGNDTNLWYRC